MDGPPPRPGSREPTIANPYEQRQQGPSHPLSTRWQRPTIQWIRQRQSIQTATTPARPPWDRFDRKTARAAVGAIGKAQARRASVPGWQPGPPLDFTVYSDGSLLNDRAGGAFCIFRGESLLGQGQIGLGELATVYDAEVLAATAGLEAALGNYMTRFATNIAICLDNEEAAIRLHDNRPTETSANAFAHFERLRHEWAARERAGCARPGVVEIRWVPGHRNIPGNELADRLAKAACSLPPDNKEATLAAARRLLKDRYISALKSHWDTNAPHRYQDLEIPAQGSPPLQELQIPARPWVPSWQPDRDTETSQTTTKDSHTQTPNYTAHAGHERPQSTSSFAHEGEPGPESEPQDHTSPTRRSSGS